MTAWQDQAACAGTPLGWWFPHKNDDTRHALTLCAECPVREECLDAAIEQREFTYGIRGGLTPNGRVLEARRRRTLQGQPCAYCGQFLPAGVKTRRKYHEDCGYRVRLIQKKEAWQRKQREAQPSTPLMLTCTTCADRFEARYKNAQLCPPCRKQARRDASTRWRKAQLVECTWCKKPAPIKKTMHDRCAAEHHTATVLHKQKQERESA